MLFWISFWTLFYIYIGYPLLAGVLARVFGRELRREPLTPTVTLLIPAYNEETHIEAKLRNSLALDYPRERLDIVVASDGSTDRTNGIAAQFADRGVRLMAMPQNIGKAAMLSRVVPQLTTGIIVFSDTSTELAPDAVRKIVQVFVDQNVACASGLYRLKPTGDVRGHGEGLYWRYETWLKLQESRLHSILGAHGAFYAIRRARFTPLESTAVNDDYIIPMRIVADGFRAVYEPSALAWEMESDVSMRGEFARRRRIAVGNCQQIIELRRLLNPFRYGWVALSFFSHKVLRTIAPVMMLAMLIGTFGLSQPWLGVFIGLQAALYLAALIGYACQRAGVRVSLFSPPLYFCLGNLAMLAGVVRFVVAPRQHAWERAR